MKHIIPYHLFEHSSLTKLGIPNEVMKYIQYHYEINSNANWIKIGLKRELIEELKKDEIAMFIEIADKYIKIIVNLSNDEFYIQYFYYETNNFGSYDIREKTNISRNQLLYTVDPKHTIYKLDGNFQHRPKLQRKVQKELKKFDKITNDFKFYMLYNFNNIIKRIYGKRYDFVMREIAKNISNFKQDASAEEILEFLKNNKKMAEKAREYEDAKEDDDLLRLKDLEKKYNSLPIIDEYLLTFEDEYSDKFNTRLNIQNLIETFGRMKIETAFMYYIFTGKLKELSVQNKK